MRPTRTRALALAAVAAVVVVAVAAYAVGAWSRQRSAVADAPPVASTELADVLAGPHVVFRSTLPGERYGVVAAVPLDDPDGPRAFTDVVCDRVDVAGRTGSCLRTVRGITTRSEAQVLDAGWRPTATWPLPGLPSRTRLSPDGSLVATTSFVTGHAYATTGFSTRTTIHRSDGTEVGDIEQFALVVDGVPFTAADRNLWGVTFVDDETFYATAASRSAGTTWLVRGSVADRSLEAVAADAECPSLSPDGTRIAYKKVVAGSAGQTVWALAVRELATGVETLLPATRGVDDQAEWLDDDTLLYGMPREGEAGTTDVWSVDARAGAEPVVLVPGAWSPAVAR